MKHQLTKDERIRRAFMKLIDEVGYLYFSITMESLEKMGIVTREHYEKLHKKK